MTVGTGQQMGWRGTRQARDLSLKPPTSSNPPTLQPSNPQGTDAAWEPNEPNQTEEEEEGGSLLLTMLTLKSVDQMSNGRLIYAHL